MSSEQGVILTLIIMYSFVTIGMLYWMGMKFKFIARIKCRFGVHTRITKKFRKTTHYYHCVICKKPRQDRELKLIDGGKKDSNFFRF